MSTSNRFIISRLLFSAELIPALVLSCPLISRAGSVPDLVVKSAAISPSGPVKVKKLSGVPAYEIFKAPKGAIPKLNIGQEAALEFQTVPWVLSPAPEKKIIVNKLPTTPAMTLSTKTTQINHVSQAKPVVSEKNIKAIPELKPLKEISEPETKTPELKTQALIDFKPQDFKLLEGLIFLENLKNYDMSLAYFTELLNDKDYQSEARYHYARAAKERGLNTEVRATLLKIAKESKNKEWKVLATEMLAENMALFDVSDMKEIDPLVQALDIDISQNDPYNFYRAKYYLEQGQLGLVEDALSLINDKSQYYHDSLLISALSNYRQAKIDAATHALESLLKISSPDEPIRSVAAMTLARIQFQKSQYKEAYKTYLEVSKNHALWLQAMVEQAWAQILNHDYEGAAGNMFSLHTDFFKNAYNPESYVVRTVGYLNLCQFGDGSQVLMNMGRRYGPIYNKLEAYSQLEKKPPLYETVRQLLKNPDMKEVDGLPRSFIIELARHPSFINTQKHINSYEDEITRFNQVSLNLVQREKDLLKKQGEINHQMTKIKNELQTQKVAADQAQALKKELDILEKKLFTNKFEYQNVNRARTSIKDVREKSFRRLDEEKSIIRQEASATLKKRFEELSKNLRAILDNNDVLNYEIYSGAGEQLRYQAAGGTGSQQERPQLKPEKDKSTTWKFKGEIWEDEIGHFRSSLKNVCAPDDSKSAHN